MSILNNYSVPKDALSDAANDDEDTPADEDVNYVDEVVYNPSDAGNALADAQNNYKVSLDFNDLNGEPIWFSGDSSASYSWKFMSGYDYKSAKVDCVWLCTSDEGHIVYAYHTATYNGVDNTFENATTHLTKEGGDSLAAD